MAITKTGICFNQDFCKAFLGPEVKSVLVMVDVKNRLIGFKIPTEDQLCYAFSVKQSIKKPGGGSNGSARRIGITRVAKAFPDSVGRAYRVTLTSERIIAADIVNENETR